MSTLRIAGIAAAAALAFSVSYPVTPASAVVQCGKASWYAMTTLTASGERANPNAMVAAHKSLPFGTRVQVKNLDNGKSITVRINDRGPFIRGRIIDLSRLAAARLGFKDQGVTRVCVTTRS